MYPILPFCEVRILMCAVWVVPLIVLVRRLVFRPLTLGSFSTLFPRLSRWSVTVRTRMSLFAFRESSENNDLAPVAFAGDAPMDCASRRAELPSSLLFEIVMDNFSRLIPNDRTSSVLLSDRPGRGREAENSLIEELRSPGQLANFHALNSQQSPATITKTPIFRRLALETGE